MAESLATEFDVFCLSMDKEVDELDNSLEDLEIDVEFISYAESYDFHENFKAWASENLLVACRWDLYVQPTGDKLTLLNELFSFKLTKLFT